MRRARALLAVLALACSGGPGTNSPERAVQALIAAARTGDRAGVYARLGPRTRDRIEGLQASTRRTSGRVVLRPEDFLSVGWAPPAWEPAGVRVLRRDANTAEVEVYSAAGDRHPLALVREDGEWRIELPGS